MTQKYSHQCVSKLSEHDNGLSFNDITGAHSLSVIRFAQRSVSRSWVIRLAADRVRPDNYRGYSGGASCFNVGGLIVGTAAEGVIEERRGTPLGGWRFVN